MSYLEGTSENKGKTKEYFVQQEQKRRHVPPKVLREIDHQEFLNVAKKI